MKKDAVLGEDGLTVNFYLTFWNLLHPSLFAAYNYAFDCGHMSITQRRGLIRLLPKKDRNPLFVSSWHPISLLNVDYKILTKLFAKRLSLFLPDLIHEDQKGFIKGRSIHDNLLDAQALIAACEDLDEEGMLILLDIHKAFDTVSWQFLRDVLIQFNFPPNFIKWFDIFYNGKELHVLNNGYISEVIFPSQGLAQGCGISPLFFVLAIEVLAIAVHSNEKIQGIMLNDTVKKISLLSDDGLLSLKWAKATLDEVISTLDKFFSLSNLKVNSHKSVVVPLGKRIKHRKRLPNLENFPHSMDRAVTYLGVNGDFLSGLGSRSETWTQVYSSELETIHSIVRNRNETHHSLLGQILSVKSLMFSRFVYKFSCLPSPPVSWFRKVQSLVNDYLWNHGVHHMVADRLYLPIDQGGLNMINFRTFDQSLKISWLVKAIKNPDSFWAKQLQYCLTIPIQDFVSYNLHPRHLSRIYKFPPTPFWQSVLLAWCQAHYTSLQGNVLSMPLAYNSAITWKTTLFTEATISHFENLGIHSVKEFSDEFETIQGSRWCSLANHIMDRMPNAWLTQIDSDNFGDLPAIESLLIQGFSVYARYRVLQSLRPVPNKSIVAWEWDLQYSHLSDSWSQICK